LTGEAIPTLFQSETTDSQNVETKKDSGGRFPYKVLIVAPSLDIMGGQAVQADLLLKNLRADEVETGFVPHNPRPPGRLYELTKYKYIRTLVVSFFYILKLLWNIPQYDIIHIFSASYRSFLISPAPAILIARYLGKKIILNYRSGECRDHLEKQGRRAIPIMKKADKIVVPSQYLVGEFADFGLEAEYVYNLVDLAQFSFKPRDIFRPAIIVARNLERLYNIPAAIKAYEIVKKKYPDAHLTIVGSGREELNIRKMVESEGIPNVTFSGRMERSEMARLYQEHDVFLNSSDIDNMPVSFLEAYACGLAVVSTNAGGISYICRNAETGILVDRHDHKGLADGILRILEDAGFGRRLTEKAKQECKKYTWSSVSEGWHRIYRELYSEQEQARKSRFKNSPWGIS
jgi:glycosyltransferase involved in cell wall biosynthesis